MKQHQYAADMKGEWFMKRFLSILVLALLALVTTAYGQKAVVTQPVDPKTTPAYSMLIERRVKVQAHLETLLNDYTSDWPPATKLQAELDALKTEMKKMNEIDQPLIPKLTSGVGAMILRKTVLVSEIKELLEEESSDWPPLKEKQRELELLDKQIQRVLS
jgi:type II secretory pathway component PulL